MRNRASVDITGKEVTRNTVTKTEQQVFADVTARTFLYATLPKTKYACSSVA
jgi:hypothetical protein